MSETDTPDATASPSSPAATVPEADAESPEDLTEEQRRQLEAEREERLSPENRPDHAEVDNTDRDFDTTTGQFTDSETDPDLGPFDDGEAV